MAGRLPPDYHVHAPYCGHAAGPMVAYVEEAINRGIPELCFTDHLGRYYLSPSQREQYGDWGMHGENLSRYVNEVRDLAETYRSDIIIRLGLEIDYIEGAEERLAEVLAPHNFDFLLGSIHVLPQVSWQSIADYAPGTFDPASVAHHFFDAAEACIASGLFDALSHPDFLWRYGAWPHGHHGEVFSRIEMLAKEAIRHDTAIEINANGYLWSQVHFLEEGDPFDHLLQTLGSLNVPVTLGSDAHAPKHVGKKFDEIVREMLSAGIRETRIFENRTARTFKLP